MPDLKFHQAISHKRTGKYYTDLHMWIDENQEHIGIDHRTKNHVYTKATRDEVAKRFGGQEAVNEWLFHIVVDSLYTYHENEKNFTKHENNLMKFGFCENGFIFFKEENVEDEDELREDHFPNYTKKEMSLLDKIADAVGAILGEDIGYCIRCGEEIKLNEDAPLCDKHYREWSKYKNPNYQEKYCHSCGEPCKTTKKEPFCKECK